MEDIEFDEIFFKKWKNEYGHPLVVGYARRGEPHQLKKVHEINTYSEIG
jgi:hypothetical protein